MPTRESHPQAPTAETWLIAIPTDEGVLSGHFGRASSFTLFTGDPSTQRLSQPRTLTPPPHEHGSIPRWLAALGVTHVLAGHIGEGAQTRLTAAGMVLHPGVESRPPLELARALLEGRLPSEGCCGSCDDEKDGGHDACGGPGSGANGRSGCGC